MTQACTPVQKVRWTLFFFTMLPKKEAACCAVLAATAFAITEGRP